jgi:ribose transport system substrate-binding protein
MNTHRSALRLTPRTAFPSILALLLCLSLLSAAPILAQQGDRWKKPIVIGWAPPDITGVFKTATDFFQAAAKDAGQHGFQVQVIAQSPATHKSFADQVAILEDFIQRKVDVIAVSPIEVQVVQPSLVRAQQAGIPVIIVNLLEPIQGLENATYVGFDNEVAAKVTAYAMLDYFGGPGVLGSGEKVEVGKDEFLDIAFWEKLYGNLTEEQKKGIKARGAIIEGIAGGFFSMARLKGFREIVGQFPGVEIVGQPCAADWNRAKGSSCAEDILQANPQNLDFIWAASNEMGMGAMLAAESAGRLEQASDGGKIGDAKVAIFTNDVTPESIQRIKEGKLIAETHHGFAEWGWIGTQFAVQLACGVKAPQKYDIRPRIAYATNADLFYPKPALPPIDWDGIKSEAK